MPGITLEGWKQEVTCGYPNCGAVLEIEPGDIIMGTYLDSDSPGDRNGYYAEVICPFCLNRILVDMDPALKKILYDGIANGTYNPSSAESYYNK